MKDHAGDCGGVAPDLNYPPLTFMFELLYNNCKQLNAEEYWTLDEFEDDLKLMAEEAKEVRDRLKVDLADAEANATAAERVAAESGAVLGGGGGSGGAAGGRAAGDDGGVRKALQKVDKATNQLTRASTAVDMACFLRDAALSFLTE